LSTLNKKEEGFDVVAVVTCAFVPVVVSVVVAVAVAVAVAVLVHLHSTPRSVQDIKIGDMKV